MVTFLNRTTDLSIEPFFLSRVSSRAFSDESLSESELMQFFEAARWAPSAFNEQPWRFIYALNGDPAFTKLYEALVDFNKQWCRRAPVLVLTLSRNRFESRDKENGTSRFDTGAAWMSLALQASMRGMVAHGMSGFDYDRVRQDFQIPSLYTIDMMIAIGKRGKKESLSLELQEKELPSLRRPLHEIISRGVYTFS